MECEYIIFVGNTKSEIESHECADTKGVAIRRALELTKEFKYVEVEYFDEDGDFDVVWENYIE